MPVELTDADVGLELSDKDVGLELSDADVGLIHFRTFQLPSEDEMAAMRKVPQISDVVSAGNVFNSGVPFRAILPDITEAATTPPVPFAKFEIGEKDSVPMAIGKEPPTS